MNAVSCCSEVYSLLPSFSPDLIAAFLSYARAYAETVEVLSHDVDDASSRYVLPKLEEGVQQGH